MPTNTAMPDANNLQPDATAEKKGKKKSYRKMLRQAGVGKARPPASSPPRALETQGLGGGAFEKVAKI